jgi:cyanate permease
MTIWYVGTVVQIASFGTHSPVLNAIGGFVGGLGIANTDVAINVDGSAIEQRLGRAALPRMHAAFSIGALVGAAIGTGAIVFNIDLTIQLAVIATAAYVIPLLGLRHMPTDNGLHTEEKKQGGGWLSIDKLVVLLGIGIFGMTLGEGASNDWLAIGIVDGYQATDADGGVAYAILVGTMTVVRFFGGSVTDRLGRAATLRYSGIIGLLGLLLIILQVSVPLAWIGSGFWGVGVALAFPLFISAAAELDDPARKVAMVSTFGYTAFLVGPPLLGFVGENIGVLNMYWLILMFIALSVVVAGAAGSRRR